GALARRPLAGQASARPQSVVARGRFPLARLGVRAQRIRKLDRHAAAVELGRPADRPSQRRRVHARKQYWAVLTAAASRAAARIPREIPTAWSRSRAPATRRPASARS